MQNYLVYLLQVCTWFIPLYVLYLLVYKKFTFFNWNRYYLLSTTLLSFVLPLVHYNIVTNKIVWSSIQTSIYKSTSIYETVTPNLQTAVQQNIAPNMVSFNFVFLIFAIYCIGVLVTSARLLKSLYSIRMMIKNAQKNWTDNVALVHTTDKVPHSSFFHYIFINNKTNTGVDMDKIIYHEMQHNEKLHSVDVLFCELVKIVLWFNPFVYWHKQSLQEIHEFEVDAEMTKLYNQVSYAELLLKIATANQHVLINTFSTKPIKTRIKMIFNPKTYPMKKISFLLVLPLIATLLFAYGNVQQKTITVVKTNNEPITIVIDAGHGGKDQGATNGTLNESTICLQITEKIVEKAKAAGFNVITTRSNDSLIALKDRAIIAKQGNVFISLHLNGNVDKNKSGIECYIDNSTEVNEKTKGSQKLGNTVLQQLATLNELQVDQNTKTRKANIYIVKETNVPSILLEIGYITNDNDAAFISNSNNQNKMAEKIVEGLTSYFVAK